MKSFKVYLCILAITTYHAIAQSSVWKIEKDGDEFYIGGTIHLLKESDYPLPSEFDEAYKSSSVLMLETDMDQLQSPAFMQSMIMKWMYTGEKTLKSELSEEAYSALSLEYKKAGILLESFNKLKPSFAIINLSMQLLKNMDVTATGVDVFYLEKAKENEKKIEFLESPELQRELLTTMGEGYENEFVLASLNDIKTMKEDFDAMHKAWKDGETTVLETQLIEMKEEYAQAYKDLVLSRNTAWMDKLTSLDDNDEIEFVLFGCLHLYGPDGVLNKLKHEGYTVTQL